MLSVCASVSGGRVGACRLRPLLPAEGVARSHTHAQARVSFDTRCVLCLTFTDAAPSLLPPPPHLLPGPSLLLYSIDSPSIPAPPRLSQPADSVLPAIAAPSEWTCCAVCLLPLEDGYGRILVKSGCQLRQTPVPLFPLKSTTPAQSLRSLKLSL